MHSRHSYPPFCVLFARSSRIFTIRSHRSHSERDRFPLMASNCARSAPVSRTATT